MENMIRAGDSLAQQLEKLLEFPDQTGFLKQEAAVNAIRNNITNWRTVATEQESQPTPEKPLDFEQSNHEIGVSLRTIIAMLKAVPHSLGERDGLFTLDDINLLINDVLRRVKLASDQNEDCCCAYELLSREFKNEQNRNISLDYPSDQFFTGLIECAIDRSSTSEWIHRSSTLGNLLVKHCQSFPQLTGLVGYWRSLVEKEGGCTVIHSDEPQFCFFVSSDTAPPIEPDQQHTTIDLAAMRASGTEAEATHHPAVQGG